MYVPNLKRESLFFQKLQGGSQNLEIRSRNPGHAHLGVVFRLDALALSVIATGTWLSGWLAGWLSVTAGMYQND